MLKSYEAIYENGQVKWLTEKPALESARIIVTVLEEASKKEHKQEEIKRQRVPPSSIAGKGKTIGDIVSPIVSENR